MPFLQTGRPRPFPSASTSPQHICVPAPLSQAYVMFVDRADFSKLIAGAFSLPPAWCATRISYSAANGKTRAVSTDEELCEAVALGKTKMQGAPACEEGGDFLCTIPVSNLLRLKIERVGMPLAECIAPTLTPARQKKKRQIVLGGRRNGGETGYLKDSGGHPVYTNSHGQRVLLYHPMQRAQALSSANAANALAAWTDVRPGSQEWVQWQRSVKVALSTTPGALCLPF